MRYKRDGIIDMTKVNLPEDWESLNRFFPVIECIEKIPCNPCSFSCPQNAIDVPGDITNLPQIDFDRCNACSICVGKCPGLAIFLVNPNFTEDSGAVTLPYEFSPLPETGDKVILIDREGKECGEGEVVKVVKSPAFENTPLVTVKMHKELVMEIRHIKKQKR